VLLHGLHATALVWKSNIESLSNHFRVYAVDIPGQGGRSVARRRVRTRRDYADWLCELCDGLGITQASLAGNSYGAFLALNQASLAPQRVTRVVLINPAGIFVSLLPQLLRMFATGAHFAWRRMAGQKPDLALLLGKNVQLRADEAEWAALVSMGAPHHRLRPNVIFPAVFSSAELRAIRAPVLLLMGDNDLLCEAHSTVRAALQRMPSLQTGILPGAHHIAAMATPTECCRRIIEFCKPSARE
jgi:pimeloyl-ACP methyl ester carboxylesterase